MSKKINEKFKQFESWCIRVDDKLSKSSIVHYVLGIFWIGMLICLFLNIYMMDDTLNNYIMSEAFNETNSLNFVIALGVLIPSCCLLSESLQCFDIAYRLRKEKKKQILDNIEE